MKKLNKKKIKWIVEEVERRELGVWTIARVQNITKQHAYRVAKKYKNSEPELKKCGRKPKQITDEERKTVVQAYYEIRASATMIEQYLDKKSIHIGHNRIHRILLAAKLAKEDHRKYRIGNVRSVVGSRSDCLCFAGVVGFKGKHALS